MGDEGRATVGVSAEGDLRNYASFGPKQLRNRSFGIARISGKLRTEDLICSKVK